MSDRAPSLLGAIDKYLDGCNQRSYFRHIFKNMTKYWRGGVIRLLAWCTAQAYKEVDFNRCMDSLEESTEGSKNWLNNIEKKLWSRAHFDTVCKSDHLTNNFTESFNKFILETRDKPVCAMVMGISLLVMKLMHDRKRDGNKWGEHEMVPRVKKIINTYKDQVNDYITEPSSTVEYSVRKWTVNLMTHTCGCGEWQVTSIPYVHAVYLISYNRFNMTK
jgi:hypothetical protein